METQLLLVPLHQLVLHAYPLDLLAHVLLFLLEKADSHLQVLRNIGQLRCSLQLLLFLRPRLDLLLLLLLQPADLLEDRRQLLVNRRDLLLLAFVLRVQVLVVSLQGFQVLLSFVDGLYVV